MTTATGGSIYGIRLRQDFEYRYVGLTTKPIDHRLRQHLKVASEERKTPFYDWLRQQDREKVVADELDWLEQLQDLGEAEIYWIAYLKRDGCRLLNISEGGLGPTGVVWTEEMREAARKRSTGRKGVSRFGPDGPFYGKHHTAEQREKWVREREGQNSGAANPNFGKFGSEHPGFGRQVSEETRRLLSEQKKGPGNPNYGKNASAETRAKMSAARKGRSMPSMQRNAHIRYHSNKGVVKDTCQYCIDDAAKFMMKRESESQHD